MREREAVTGSFRLAMIHTPHSLRLAGTALAAVLAIASTPSLAQDAAAPLPISPEPVVVAPATPTPVAPEPVMVQQPTVQPLPEPVPEASAPPPAREPAEAPVSRARTAAPPAERDAPAPQAAEDASRSLKP